MLLFNFLHLLFSFFCTLQTVNCSPFFSKKEKKQDRRFRIGLVGGRKQTLFFLLQRILITDFVFFGFFFGIFSVHTPTSLFSDFRPIIGDYRNLLDRNGIIGLPIIIGELESLMFLRKDQVTQHSKYNQGLFLNCEIKLGFKTEDKTTHILHTNDGNQGSQN